MQGSKGGSATRMSGHHSRLMRLESSLFILPDLLQQRSSEFGGLVLEEFIGQGSFGRVYKGTALRLCCPSDHLCCVLSAIQVETRVSSAHACCKSEKLANWT